MGLDDDPRRAVGRQGRAPSLCRRRLRRDLDEHMGAADRAARREPASVGIARPGPLDGRCAPRRPPGAGRGRGRRARRRGRRRFQHQRRCRYPGRPRDDPATGARVRGGAARPDLDGDLVAGPDVHVRHGRGAARHRASRVAELPSLPSRRLRGLRRALGRPGGRRVWSRCTSFRGDGRRRARHQLHPARPRPGDAVVAAGLHRSAARRLPEPRLPLRRGLAGRERRRRRRVRRPGAAVA